MAKIRLKTGSEGPRHDPYSYTEITFTRTDGAVVTCHMGLAQRVSLNGKALDVSYDEVEETFARLAGLTFQQAEKIFYNADERMLRGRPRREREQFYAMREADARLLAYAL